MKWILTVSVNTSLSSESLEPSHTSFGGHGGFAGEWAKSCIACLQSAMACKSDIAGPPRGQKGLPQLEPLHFTPFSK